MTTWAFSSCPGITRLQHGYSVPIMQGKMFYPLHSQKQIQNLTIMKRPFHRPYQCSLMKKTAHCSFDFTRILIQNTCMIPFNFTNLMMRVKRGNLLKSLKAVTSNLNRTLVYRTLSKRTQSVGFKPDTLSSSFFILLHQIQHLDPQQPSYPLVLNKNQ